MRWLLLTLLLLVTACGYHFPGKGESLPGGVTRVYAPLFTNRTSEARLENRVSNDISYVFARNGNISLVEDKQQAEAILEGTVSDYRTRALSYDSDDDISEYRATMVAQVSLRSIADGRLLWQGSVSWSEDYLAADDKNLQNDNEKEAIEEISLRLSEEILTRMLDDF
ncbi:Outer membrane lipoprotein LptE/RlpB (LPS assembly) [Malonomonas rubra DSM 5091]|uniref:Outer membrane lipoprotein LptE/RlpB (LPS assembly) n=1 Tax=Malonomonas rubra DSM 5091 TaxID=1122189 RepID=A0A1M6DFC4_MALRU|nr:LPS assembly lipoprotein LptE [Malonomonas rubra]SHI71759.1 Outer membrane lipoprotein LptE/RlpB (LPS assembly) [Malonomonas rubra DSM 5091]